jgi:hypothetical protein
MNCPFCRVRLTSYHYPTHAAYVCEDAGCINDDMPRYQVSYNNYPTCLISRTFMLDKYYIHIDYKQDTTTISVLEACFLLDSVRVAKALAINLNDIVTAAEKIKTLMVFS